VLVLDSMGALGSEVSAAHAKGEVLSVSEAECATSRSSLGGELVDLAVALLLGDTFDSHHAGLSAGDHLVGANLGVVAAMLLGFAHSGALALVSDDLGAEHSPFQMGSSRTSIETGVLVLDAMGALGSEVSASLAKGEVLSVSEAK